MKRKEYETMKEKKSFTTETKKEKSTMNTNEQKRIMYECVKDIIQPLKDGAYITAWRFSREKLDDIGRYCNVFCYRNSYLYAFQFWGERAKDNRPIPTLHSGIPVPEDRLAEFLSMYLDFDAYTVNDKLIDTSAIDEVDYDSLHRLLQGLIKASTSE